MTPGDPSPPLISTVLSTHDRPELLIEAAESVLAQTYPNVELIVVDDHSPTPVEPVLREALPAASVDVR